MKNFFDEAVLGEGRESKKEKKNPTQSNPVQL